ncbi:MAG: aromatic amino acid lyase, partial [Hyphomicrobiaceae bacterium]|nr:aromatic amino acid lyase [Hyphomicrobiaceae bacterium]
MAAHAARRLMKMTANLRYILGVELMCAAQGIGFRAPLATSAPLKSAVAVLRHTVPPLTDDRALGEDIEYAASIIANGSLVASVKEHGDVCIAYQTFGEPS